ncbi:MAG: HD-GYP domain-containing protein [Sedimentisphaerales bacterium]|nr:HD-GYP domain-containing protein [Sedimentisphaerales bacterium]
MANTRDELIQYLQKLAGLQSAGHAAPDAAGRQDGTGSAPGSDPQTPPPRFCLDGILPELPPKPSWEDIDAWTQLAGQSVWQILNLFEQLDSSNQQLAQELLGFYEQFNCTFEASARVAQCKDIEKALPVLIDELTRTLDCSHGIYIGPLWEKLQLPQTHIQPDKMIAYQCNPERDARAAREFFERYEQDLLGHIRHTIEEQVLLYGYEGPPQEDMEGRGNILIIRLQGSDRDINHSAILLVRTTQPALFAAADMKLAASLAKMGAAMLDNILYSQKLQQSSLQTVASLVRAMEAKDAYTSGHSTRVAQLACQLGRHIGLKPREIQVLEKAALLHDIGKIGIREEILNKPGRLTEAEFRHIQSHPVKSCNVLEPIDALRDIQPAVRHHHEHFDGSGYPDGLKGAEIPLLARILQIADVWDALTSTRSYRGAMPREKALHILQEEAGTTMDPDLVKQFLEIIHQVSWPDGAANDPAPPAL